MPVNLLHSWLHRVEKGWDPISPIYAQEYDKRASGDIDPGLIGRLATLSGGLAGKKVLDLGGGPGHCSVLFAKSGAQVTWHDVSREYEKIARKRAEANGVSLEFSLGYLEEARRFARNSFDVVFCRVCWNYCKSDRAFGKLLYGLLKPGGVGYIECNTPAVSSLRSIRKLQSWSNEWLWLKIGHPMPPHGRIAKLIHRYPVSFMEVDYRSKRRDIVTFVKSKQAVYE